ncbi:MAG: hypothetical protein ACREHF_02745 [Rhizomicrobium sp.]
MRRGLAALLLLGLGFSLAGCVYYGPPPGPGPRWCYHHPRQCPPPPP